MRSLRDYDQSLLWKRLDELSGSDEVDRTAVDHLKASVRKVAENATWIGTQICRYMPQYTLHEERHFLNVLAIMEALLPAKVLQQLSPLECVLPILAAYTHDLGMALSLEEHDLLLDESTDEGKHFASYRTRFDEELRQLDRWRKRLDDSRQQDDDDSKHEAAQAKKRIDAIEGHILSSYLRETHTEDDQIRRIRHWLESIKQETGDDNLFRYGNFDYQRTLALIGISHGRGAPWLRRQLIDGGLDDRFFQTVATGESTNLAFPGLLLRLADVMDFDASRTPRILFKHFGIENDQSVLEWNKHLSIVGWRLAVDPDGKQQPDLLYSAECEHPVHEKAIREFKTWIDAELSNVRIELDAQRRQLPAASQNRYDLHLPSQTRLDIRSARNPLSDQPKYVYHDLQFRLDQDEIQQLLMGESLYGDPGLCIRELLQNSLDALELRELRLKMKRKGEAREPVDGELIRPGWVREPDGREEELRVTLDWGTDEETGQQWLRVTDNGVGMTEDVIKNYFTQIGKSYYRSPEFNQERAAMKAAGEVVSPVSIFGIGILSCFMMSNRLLVRTNPGRASRTSVASLDVDISGPGSLFWMKTGTLTAQGTEVTVWLRPKFRIEHEFQKLLPQIKRHLSESYQRPYVAETGGIDPALVVAATFVWPRYPILIRPVTTNGLRLSDDFHVPILASLDRRKVLEVAEPWGCKSFIGDVAYQFFDWVDDQVETGTGTRVRVLYPNNSRVGGSSIPTDSGTGLCRQDEIASFVEAQLVRRERITVLANGMKFQNSSELTEVVSALPRIGSHIWVDLRGNVIPPLSIDRQRFRQPTDRDRWRSEVRAVFDRMHRSVCATLETSGDDVVKNFQIAVNWKHHSQVFARGSSPPSLFDFTLANCPAWSEATEPMNLELMVLRLAQEKVRVGSGVAESFREYERRGLQRSFSTKRHSEVVTVLEMACSRTPEGFRESAFSALKNASDGDSPPKWIGDEDFPEALGVRPVIKTDIDYQMSSRFEVLRFGCLASILQEALQPTLVKSWPVYRLNSLKGRIGDFAACGPGLVKAKLDRDGRTVRFADPQGRMPEELVQRGYDLTFPMTAVPLGQLRRKCGAWRTTPWCRPLGVAPFLLPSLYDVWKQQIDFFKETFGVPQIYCLLPRFELWCKRFSDWDDEDWNHPENLSALWDLSGELTGTAGQVLWTRGAHDISEMPKIGLPAPAFLEAAAK